MFVSFTLYPAPDRVSRGSWEPSINTFRSPFSPKFLRRCVLCRGTQHRALPCYRHVYVSASTNLATSTKTGQGNK